jgi:putative hemolysin
VSVKAIYANLAAGAPVRIKDLMTRPLIVPATQSVIQLLDTMKQTGKHIGLVADEFGSIVGLVTINDVMESIVGEFPTLEQRLQPEARHLEDGSWLIDAMIEMEKLERLLPGFPVSDEADRDYRTLAGFVMKRLGEVPKEGQTFEAGGYVFEVLDMDGPRVDKVLALPATGAAPPAGSEPAQI